MKRDLRGVVAVLTVTVAAVLSFAGCGGETSPSAADDVRAAPAPIVRSLPGGGGMMIDPGVRHVATLRRQPDGTFKRTCGPPSDDARAAFETVRRARKVAP